jgi:hypothetical protein
MPTQVPVRSRRRLVVFAAVAGGGVLFGVGVMIVAEHVVAATAEDDGCPSSGMRQQAVSLEKFTQIRAGMKQAAIDTLLGPGGEHQFTYVDQQGAVWQCVEYTIAHDPKYASTAFELLYKNGALFALVDSMDAWNHAKAQFERPNGRKERRPIPAYDADQNIREFFHVKSLRGEEIANTMPQLKERILDGERQSRAREKNNPPDLGLTIVMLLLGSGQAETRRAYKANAEYRKRFDGNRVTVGMTPARVEQLFGKPLVSQDLADSKHAAIYGPKETKEIALVQPYLECEPVLVLYRKNAVIRVLSNSYFTADWRDKVWPELKSPERGSRPD